MNQKIFCSSLRSLGLWVIWALHFKAFCNWNYCSKYRIVFTKSVGQRIITKFLNLKKGQRDVTGRAQWVEHRPANWEVTGLIPSQDTCLGCGPGLQLGTCKRQPLMFLFLFFSPLPLSLKINKIFLMVMTYHIISLFENSQCILT